MLNRSEFDQVKYKYILFLKDFDKSQLEFNNKIKSFLENNKHKIQIIKNKFQPVQNIINEKSNYKFAIKFEIETRISQNKKTAELSPESYIFLEYIDQIVDQLSKEGDLIYDKFKKKIFKKDSKLTNNQFPNFKQRIKITRVNKNGNFDIRSHGLNKFGIPDIEVLQVPSNQKSIAKKIIHQTAKKLLFYDKFEYNFEGYNVKLEQMHNSKGIFNKSQLRLTYAKQ